MRFCGKTSINLSVLASAKTDTLIPHCFWDLSAAFSLCYDQTPSRVLWQYWHLQIVLSRRQQGTRYSILGKILFLQTVTLANAPRHSTSKRYQEKTPSFCRILYHVQLPFKLSHWNTRWKPFLNPVTKKKGRTIRLFKTRSERQQETSTSTGNTLPSLPQL